MKFSGGKLGHSLGGSIWGSGMSLAQGKVFTSELLEGQQGIQDIPGPWQGRIQRGTGLDGLRKSLQIVAVLLEGQCGWGQLVPHTPQGLQLPQRLCFECSILASPLIFLSSYTRQESGCSQGLEAGPGGCGRLPSQNLARPFLPRSVPLEPV